MLSNHSVAKRMKYIPNLLVALLVHFAAHTLAQKLESNVVPPAPSDGVFDPDGILTLQQRQNVAGRLEELDVSIKIAGSEPAKVQMAVAVVDRIDMTSSATMEEDEAAEQLARKLHDAWGVGYQTESGGTGVLIFLSIYDRIVYISRGGALDRILNDGRIDNILYAIRPAMRQTAFADGLLLAINEVVRYIENGEPTWKETFLGLFHVHTLFLLVWLGALINGLTRSRRQRQEQRAYAEAASQLSEIDRAQAEALQGQYEATSCPVCLEPFKSSRIGSDGQPIKLLRCGHVFDESCWSEWVSSGHGNITKCPICKMDIAQPPMDASTAMSPSASSQESTTHELDVGTNLQQRARDASILRRFQQERNFRLMQLGARYPNFITQSQIGRWSSPTYDGSLARDPVFRQRSPQEVARQHALRQDNGMGSARPISFGGGYSSGGRAGRF